MRAPLVLGWACVLVAGLALGGWTTQARLASAIVAPGIVDPGAQIIPLSHPSGGVVADVAVREAQEVDAGAVLLRLDDTELAQELAVMDAQIAALNALITRLAAEIDGTEPPPANGATPGVDAATDAQQRLFAARHRLRAEQAAMIERQRALGQVELAGLRVQEQAVQAERGLLAQDLQTREDLRARGLGTAEGVRAAQLALTRAEGALAALAARIEAAHSRDAALQAEAQAEAAAHRAEAEGQRSEAERALADLHLRRAALDQRRAARTLVAPVAGQVLGLHARAGATLQPGQVALRLIDTQHPPRLLALIAPDDMDRLYLGQTARLHPGGVPLAEGDAAGIEARVIDIPAAPEMDEQRQAAFYRIGLTPVQAAGDMPLPGAFRPGARFQVTLVTGQQRPLDYLLAPLARRLRPILTEP